MALMKACLFEVCFPAIAKPLKAKVKKQLKVELKVWDDIFHQFIVYS